MYRYTYFKGNSERRVSAVCLWSTQDLVTTVTLSNTLRNIFLLLLTSLHSLTRSFTHSDIFWCSHSQFYTATHSFPSHQMVSTLAWTGQPLSLSFLVNNAANFYLWLFGLCNLLFLIRTSVCMLMMVFFFFPQEQISPWRSCNVLCMVVGLRKPVSLQASEAARLSYMKICCLWLREPNSGALV